MCKKNRNSTQKNPTAQNIEKNEKNIIKNVLHSKICVSSQQTNVTFRGKKEKMLNDMNKNDSLAQKSCCSSS